MMLVAPRLTPIYILGTCIDLSWAAFAFRCLFFPCTPSPSFRSLASTAVDGSRLVLAACYCEALEASARLWLSCRLHTWGGTSADHVRTGLAP